MLSAKVSSPKIIRAFVHAMYVRGTCVTIFYSMIEESSVRKDQGLSEAFEKEALLVEPLAKWH